ncbi:nucleotidyltransferase domain-containing protein [archaeon]|nr:nucleotidyltransferase domain-containing protein [archaeon]
MNIINFLRRNNNTRKIFGIRELKIIEKQLHGINLTQSEKNRLSRDIRKKLEFIKEVSRFSDYFKLKKGEIIKEIIEDTVRIIKEDQFYNKIKRIILYGSVVENKITFRSDIDIAVEFHTIDLKKATLFRKRVLGEANPKIDIQVYNILPEKIKKEIDNKGKELWKKE